MLKVKTAYRARYRVDYIYPDKLLFTPRRRPLAERDSIFGNLPAEQVDSKFDESRSWLSPANSSQKREILELFEQLSEKAVNKLLGESGEIHSHE